MHVDKGLPCVCTFTSPEYGQKYGDAAGKFVLGWLRKAPQLKRGPSGSTTVRNISAHND